MEKHLLALNIFKKQPDAIAVGQSSSQIDYQEIGVAILLKFVDVLEGAIIIAAGLFAVRLVKRYFAKIETAHEQQKTALSLLEKITSGFIIVVSITLGLKVIGLDLTLIVSVLTLGLSFGLRDVIKNYVAGLLILFKAPFKIGDVVKIRSFIGKIERIEFQSVTLRTFDRKEITIHNSDLLTQPLTNFSRTERMRLEIEIPLGYGTDLMHALAIFDRIFGNSQMVLKSPKYSIIFRKFGGQGTIVLMRFWVQKPCNPLRIKSALALQMQEAFDEEKIFAPYTREAGLAGEFGMTALRKERLQRFYGQPMLADIAGQTVAAVAATVAKTVSSEGQPAAALAEEYADAEEPE